MNKKIKEKTKSVSRFEQYDITLILKLWNYYITLDKIVGRLGPLNTNALTSVDINMLGLF